MRGTPTFFINGQPLVGAQPYAVIAQAIEVALAGETLATPTSPPPSVPPFDLNPERPGYTYGGDAYCGSEEDEITLAAFVDFQSPDNRQHFLEEWPELKKKYVDTGKVRLMVKHFPAPDHTQGFTAAEAAECAGQQGTFCSMYDLLFQKQDEWSQVEDISAILKRAVAGGVGGRMGKQELRHLSSRMRRRSKLNFVTPFCTCNRQGRCEARHVAEEFGIPCTTVALTEEFFQVIREPRYGYGSGMNPCLDCRILMFSQARERMEETGAARDGRHCFE